MNQHKYIFKKFNYSDIIPSVNLFRFKITFMHKRMENS